MAVATYVKISDITGECKETAHKKWLQVESARFEVHQPTSARFGTAGGHSAGEAEFRPITVQMTLDLAYPTIAQSCWLGTHHAEATIDFCRAGTDKQLFLQYKFKDVMISSVRLISEKSSNDELPIVELTFIYRTVSNEYFQQSPSGGGIEGSVVTGFDLSERVPM